MFQLFKKRNFNDLISDTFSFFKLYGKNYIKNYIVVNGGFILILLLLLYLIGNVFFEVALSGFGSQQSGILIEEYFNNNSILFIGAIIITILLVMIISVISFAYPVIYLSLIEKKPNPSISQIITSLKSKTGKIFIFFIFSLFTFIPIIIVASFLSILLIAIIIGIPIFIILLSAISCWICLSFYDYLNNSNNYFAAMKNGFNLLFLKFWNNVGSTAIFYVIIQIVLGIVSFIPYVLGIASLISNTQSIDSTANPDSFTFFGIMMLITLIISIVSNYLLTNLLLINQGLIYYSSREVNENHTLHSDIDLIGTNNE